MQRTIVMAAIFAAAFGLSQGPALAGPCSDNIAKFEQTVRQDANKPGAGPTAAQTVGAQLSHQPTPESVKQAEDKAQNMFNAVLARAKALDAAGDPACKQTLEDARLIYDLK